jgi:hypothetical protein
MEAHRTRNKKGRSNFIDEHVPRYSDHKMMRTLSTIFKCLRVNIYRPYLVCHLEGIASCQIAAIARNMRSDLLRFPQGHAAKSLTSFQLQISRDITEAPMESLIAFICSHENSGAPIKSPIALICITKTQELQ